MNKKKDIKILNTGLRINTLITCLYKDPCLATIYNNKWGLFRQIQSVELFFFSNKGSSNFEDKKHPLINELINFNSFVQLQCSEVKIV